MACSALLPIDFQGQLNPSKEVDSKEDKNSAPCNWTAAEGSNFRQTVWVHGWAGL